MRFLPFILFLATAIMSSAAEPATKLEAIDAALARVAVHAKNYPPRFASATERSKTETELKETLATLDALVASHPDDGEILLRDGFANAMGHNLDFKGCAQKSATTFEHLLALQPDNKMANLHYGAFLGSTGRVKESIPYLKKAIELGATEANYSLAVSYLMLEDKTNALVHLKTYISLYPRDEGAKKLKVALESKDLKFERKDGPPPEKQSTQ